MGELVVWLALALVGLIALYLLVIRYVFYKKYVAMLECKGGGTDSLCRKRGCQGEEQWK